MKPIYTVPESLTGEPFSFCPGCGHGIVFRLIAEVMDELGIREKSVGIVGVGCSSRGWSYLECDMLTTAHGRCCAAATGFKRTAADKLVFTYQGDGDACSIGFSETMYSAIRGEKVTAIIVNNSVYAMTGGQMGPTTLPGQKTVTSPDGRDVNSTGYPLHFAEMVGTLGGTAYAARVSVDNVPGIRKAKKAIRTAFETQLAGKGFTLVEVLSQCPTVLRKTPVDAAKWVREELTREFPLGEFKNSAAAEKESQS